MCLIVVLLKVEKVDGMMVGGMIIWCLCFLLYDICLDDV